MEGSDRPAERTASLQDQLHPMLQVARQAIGGAALRPSRPKVRKRSNPEPRNGPLPRPGLVNQSPQAPSEDAHRRFWSINGRFLAQPITGVQRYAREIVGAIDNLLQENDALADVLRLDLLVPVGVQTPEYRSIRVRHIAGMTGHLWEQIALPIAVDGPLINLCNTAPLLLRKQIVCMHDMNFRICPSSYTWAFRSLYALLLPALGHRVAAVTTVSRFSAEQLVRFGIVPESRISIHPNGFEHAASWKAAHDTATSAVAGPRTIVIIGSRAPHKNVDMILNMADKLAAAGLQIALVGSRDDRVFAETEIIEGNKVVELGRLSDQALAALLQDALCLAFPSLTEGFGLPPLEAMANGCPVVVSTEGSLPEICGSAALYASPYDQEQWLVNFIRLRDDAALRSRLSIEGRRRAREFSWRESAKLYLNLMADLDGLQAENTRL
jgi:glycosyltransferase involved in cell wall biosynthesis